VKIPGKMAVLSYGDPTVTFVFLLLFSISLMTFAFAISTFFSKGLTIATCILRVRDVWYISYSYTCCLHPSCTLTAC